MYGREEKRRKENLFNKLSGWDLNFVPNLCDLSHFFFRIKFLSKD
jgi:hypothetical protein